MSLKTGPKGASNQDVPFDPIKKKNAHTLCLPIRKLYALGNLKWAQGSQWRKQRTSHYACKNKLYFIFYM